MKTKHEPSRFQIQRRADLDRRKSRRKQFADAKVRMPGRYVRARSIVRAEGAKERRQAWDWAAPDRLREHLWLEEARGRKAVAEDVRESFLRH